jgi:hypothetical protein
MNEPDLLVVEDTARLSVSEIATAKQIAETLHQHYPGHAWAVNVDEHNGIATIKNMMLSGHYGFVLHLPDVCSATQLARQAVMAGGELLERYRQRRGAINVPAILAEPVNSAGNLIPDL